MSSANETGKMNSTEIVKRLKNIHSGNPDVKNNLLLMAEKFQCLDHVAKSIGLLKKNFTFANTVSWNEIFPLLEDLNNNVNDIEVNHIAEKLSDSTDQLQNTLIPRLQSLRNKWMLEVMLLDFLIISIFAFMVAGITYIQGLWNFSEIHFPVQALLYERPIFSLIVLSSLFFSFIFLHFTARKYVARHIIKLLSKENSEFDFIGAFLKNTRIQHSIFRPDIAGLSRWNKRCLLKFVTNTVQ